MRILLAEGDSGIASFLRKGLEAEHYAVDVSADTPETAFLAHQFCYDLLVLDLNLNGGMRGEDVLRSIRAGKSVLPILALSASQRAEDRARALDLGADDVLTRPFSFCELAARLRALLRRGARPAESTLRAADLTLDRVEHTVERAGRSIPVTSKEFALLEYLLRNQGRAVSRAMIVEHVWNLSFDTSTNIVDVYINYLRRKLDDGFDPPLIQTVRGVGYRLEVPQDEATTSRRQGTHPAIERRASSMHGAQMAAGRGARR